MDSDKEKLSERFSIEDNEEFILKKNKKRYENLSLAMLLEEIDKKTSEVEKYTKDIEVNSENDVDTNEESDCDDEKDEDRDYVEYTGKFERGERDY